MGTFSGRGTWKQWKGRCSITATTVAMFSSHFWQTNIKMTFAESLHWVRPWTGGKARQQEGAQKNSPSVALGNLIWQIYVGWRNFFKWTELNLIFKNTCVTLSDAEQISQCKIQGNSINTYVKRGHIWVRLCCYNIKNFTIFNIEQQNRAR